MKLVSAYPFKCLKVRVVNVLVRQRTISIEVAGLIVAVEYAWLHVQFLSLILVSYHQDRSAAL